MRNFAWLVNLFLIVGLVIAVFFSSSYNESDRDVVWTKFLGKMGRDIAYDLTMLDDGIVVVGWTTSSNGTGDQNAMIVKMAKDGKLLWQREFGWSGNEGANCVERTKDGGFIVGIISDSKGGDTPAEIGNQDVWILKFNGQGDLLWKKCYGTEGYESIFDIVEDEGYLFVGYTTKNGSEDFWVVKVNETGDLVWEKTFGGKDWDCAFAVDSTKDSYFVVGMTKSTDGDVTSPHGSSDMWILKLTKQGKLLWQRSIGGVDWDQASDVVALNDGGCVVLGTSWSEELSHLRKGNFVFAKFNANGLVELLKSYGGSRDDIAQKLVKLEDGYLLVGTTWSEDGDVKGKTKGSDYWLLKISRDGEIMWSKCLGAEMDEIAYALTIDGYTCFVAGISYSHMIGLRTRSHGGGDALLFKLEVKKN
ncbi:hypothetical protein [Pseudothermotoga sp.]|uniref:hypothetical protein n=1 Tax=Pseudothermotoga sp. TaxID=2033661 RepID=UPI0031F6E869